MTIGALFSPRFLLPLTLLTPYVFVLHYGISVLELLLWLYLLLAVLPAILQLRLRLPKFLLIFLGLYTFGYLGALTNGVNWGVPIGVWNLNFFYKAILGIGAFCAGMSYRADIAKIFQGRLMLFTIVLLGALAVVYPFLAFETKVRYFGIFYPQGSGFEEYLTSRRMPGLGLNANVYAFIVYCYMTFSLRAFLEGKTHFVIPLVSFLVILVLSSKLIIALAVATGLFLVARSAVRFSKTAAGDGLLLAFRKRGFSVAVGLTTVAVLIVFAATQTKTGQQIVDGYATVQRFEAAFAQQSPDERPQGFALRFEYWQKGLDRVELAPFLGIAKDPFRRINDSLVGFYNPHNEFLRMWLLYGLAGLAAWCYLLGYMIYKNLRHDTDIVWVLLYGALIVFMIFDGGLDDPRVNAFFYLFLGLNWSQIRRAKAIPETREGYAAAYPLRV